jgi:hypothetical protein
LCPWRILLIGAGCLIGRIPKLSYCQITLNGNWMEIHEYNWTMETLSEEIINEILHYLPPHERLVNSLLISHQFYSASKKYNTSFNIYRFGILNFKYLKGVLESWPSLTSLKLHAPIDPSQDHIPINLFQLKELTIRGYNSKSTIDRITTLISNNIHLVTLNFETNVLYEEFSKLRCDKVTEVSLMWTSTDTSISKKPKKFIIFDMFPAMTSLDCTLCDRVGLFNFAHPLLMILHVSHTEITDEMLEIILSSCPRIESLSFDSCLRLTYPKISSMSLEVVSCQNCQFARFEIKNAPNLRRLTLTGCSHLTEFADISCWNTLYINLTHTPFETYDIKFLCPNGVKVE